MKQTVMVKLKAPGGECEVIGRVQVSELRSRFRAFTFGGGVIFVLHSWLPSFAVLMDHMTMLT